VLANRLSQSAQFRVVLVEAGPRDESWLIRTPAAVGALINHPRFNWNYSTAPQAQLAGRRLPMPRGRVLGGTGSINGMVYIRGHASDFDAWADQCGADWNFAHLLPYFVRSENNQSYRRAPYHGTAGPMSVTSIEPYNPLVDHFLQAARSLDLPACDDFNGGQMEGFGARQATIRRGRRESTATAFLKPVLRRRNLSVLTDCLVKRVIIEDGRATGIELERDGRIHRIKAQRETILCAGAFGSPAVLMRSGVGPPTALRDIGIVVAAGSPEVGRNLADHLSCAIVMRTHSTESYGLSWRTLPRGVLNVAQYLLMKRGPLASNVFEAHGFVRTSDDLELPDVQIIFMPAYRNPSGFPIPLGHGYGINVALLTPRSRGYVTVSSDDPHAPPVIDPCFLSDPADSLPMVRGLKLARRILGAPAFQRFDSQEVTPGPAAQDDAALEAYVRNTCGTVFHPVGTCRMGSDARSVVDPQLRVRGVEGLRIADASIFPTLIRGNTNAAVVMVGEKAADMILGKAAPAPIEELRT
jgi:choline dehydrogenase